MSSVICIVRGLDEEDWWGVTVRHTIVSSETLHGSYTLSALGDTFSCPSLELHAPSLVSYMLMPFLQTFC